MNTGHKELQNNLKKYYKDMNEFIRQKQVQESLAKLRELSDKANNK